MAKAEIHNRVRELRARDGLTQADLARAVGCTRQTILSLERGRYVPSLALAFQIARVFELGIEDVFEWEESR